MGKNSICIIPARGGSKRIPRKNIKKFQGKPIIAYSIETALKSGLFNEVMVSTDDSEIASIAKEYGASVPFMRSANNSDDYATTFDVIKEVIEAYLKNGIEFSNVCCFYPCAPFVTVFQLQDAAEKLRAFNFDSVFPIIKYGHPIQRALTILDNNVVMADKNNQSIRSQDFIPHYHDSGQFYFCNIANLLQKKSLMTNNSSFIVVSELESQDIDTLSDWRIAEFKYKLLNEQNPTV